mgnify:CR=1 FL=1
MDTQSSDERRRYYDERVALYAALPNDTARAELFLTEVLAKHGGDESALEVQHAMQRLAETRQANQ